MKRRWKEPINGAFHRSRGASGACGMDGEGAHAMEPMKFVALDRDDLDVVSTHLQDALVKVADIMWRPQEKRLVVSLRRFDWLSAEATRPELRRCHSALRFERVNSCKCRSV